MMKHLFLFFLLLVLIKCSGQEETLEKPSDPVPSDDESSNAEPSKPSGNEPSENPPNPAASNSVESSGAEPPAFSNPESGAEPPASSNPESGAEPPASSNPESGAEPPASSNPESGAEPPASSNPESGAEPPASSNPESGAESPAPSGSEDSSSTEATEGVPTQPTEESPSTEASEVPTEPTEETPSTEASEVPTEPTEETPSTEASEVPTEPTEETPSTEASEVPTEPTEETPSTEASEVPTEPTEETPSTEASEVPTEPTEETSSTTAEPETTPSEVSATLQILKALSLELSECTFNFVQLEVREDDKEARWDQAWKLALLDAKKRNEDLITYKQATPAAKNRSEHQETVWNQDLHLKRPAIIDGGVDVLKAQILDKSKSNATLKILALPGINKFLEREIRLTKNRNCMFVIVQSLQKQLNSLLFMPVAVAVNEAIRDDMATLAELHANKKPEDKEQTEALALKIVETEIRLADSNKDSSMTIYGTVVGGLDKTSVLFIVNSNPQNEMPRDGDNQGPKEGDGADNSDMA